MNHTLRTPLDRLFALLAARQSGGRMLAVFDCDGTLIKGDIGEAMLYYQLEHVLFRISPAAVWPDFPQRKDLHRMFEVLIGQEPEKARQDRLFDAFADMVLSWYFDQLAQGKTAKACADIVRLCAGFSPAEVREIADETAKSELSSSFTTRRLGRRDLSRGVRYIEESLSILEHVRDAGAEIWVVSGSNRWSVEAILEQLGLSPNRILGIDLVRMENSLTSSVRQPIPVFNGKVEAISKFVARQPDIVIGDSILDIPLFKHSAGLRVLVNSNGEPSQNFFDRARVPYDDSWVVIESPTIRT